MVLLDCIVFFISVLLFPINLKGVMSDNKYSPSWCVSVMGLIVNMVVILIVVLKYSGVSNAVN